METSQIVLNHGLTFLAVATGIILIVVGGFLVKLLVDLSNLTKNLDETTAIIKAEIKPTFEEFNKALTSLSSIAQNADKQVDSLSNLLENLFGASAIMFSRARKLSGGIIKNVVKGLVTVVKLFLKK